MAISQLEPKELLEHFGVERERGLTLEQVRRRQAEHGRNELEDRGPPSPWKILVAQFQDLMVLILLVATGVAFLSWWLDGAHGLPADAIVILTIVVVNAWLGFSQEYKAEQVIRELQASTKSVARVLREGQLSNLDQAELVPGDLVYLGEGDLVPADLILFDSKHVGANESLLTGESVPVAKNSRPVAQAHSLGDRTNELFAGTTITSGQGIGVVTGTGQATQLGQIAHTLQTTTSETTPLEVKLGILGKQIGWGVLILSVLIGAVVLLVEGKLDTPTLLRVAMFSVALAVAAVPEGLPAVLTVSLSIGARKLARRNVLCRQMSAVETLGSVTTIVTDKTGTLTKNEMTIRSLYCHGETVGVSGDGYSTVGELDNQSDHILELIEAGVLASGGALEQDSDGANKAVGDPMDAGFLVLAEKAGIDWSELRKKRPEIDTIPFSSERARVSVLRGTAEGKEIYIKGAIDRVLPLCSRDQEGKLLSEEQISDILKVEQEFSEHALRGLALAQRSTDSDQISEQEFRFLGLAGFEDPPRPEVKDSIRRCKCAGVRVIMCTGDHPDTAAAIARRIELGNSNDPTTVTGQEFDKLTSEQALETAVSKDIFARFSPQQKLQLVESLIDSGEVVAMTGDGVNDAPALKKVHVGVAMGKGGTAVAVEAGDLVLTDDKFQTIVNAVREGRAVYANIQRFIAFLFSGNFGVVVAMFCGTLLAGFFDLRYEGSVLLPLSAAQILWMNLVTDGAPALAFAAGRTSETVMSDPPRHPRDPILDRSAWMLVCLNGFVLAALFLFILDLFYAGGFFTFVDWGPQYTRSLAFYALITGRLLNAFNFTDLKLGLWSKGTRPNAYLIGAVGLSWLLSFFLVTIPWAANFFGLSVLSLSHILTISLVLPPLILLPSNLFKLLRG